MGMAHLWNGTELQSLNKMLNLLFILLAMIALKKLY